MTTANFNLQGSTSLSINIQTDWKLTNYWKNSFTAGIDRISSHLLSVCAVSFFCQKLVLFLSPCLCLMLKWILFLMFCIFVFFVCFFFPLWSKTADSEEQSIFVPNKGGGGGLRLRDGVLFHMYVSSSPCGDARLNCPYETTAACETNAFRLRW